MKVGFGATQARRLLAAVEINDRIDADQPAAVVQAAEIGPARPTVIKLTTRAEPAPVDKAGVRGYRKAAARAIAENGLMATRH